MYMLLRNITAHPGRMPDAIALAVAARDRANSEQGGHYGVSVNVGGNPAALSLAGVFETLGQYETMRAALAQDDEIQSIVRLSGDLITSVQDTIGQVMKPPSARGAYAQVNTAMMHMPAVVDAIGFALEVAEYVDDKLGRDVGVVTAMTGNRAGLMWLGYTESLDQLATESQTLETDPGYLDFFKRSESLFVPGSLEQSIWQLMP